jgi:hypothetical protein
MSVVRHEKGELMGEKVDDIPPCPEKYLWRSSLLSCGAGAEVVSACETHDSA